MGPGDWLAAVALVLSLLSLWLQFGSRYRADIIVRFVKYPPTSDRGRADVLLIFHNAGAAPARNVKVSADSVDGRAVTFLQMLHDETIPIIAPGHEYAVGTTLRLGGPRAVNVTVSWRDRRPSRRSQTTTVSMIPTRA